MDIAFQPKTENYSNQEYTLVPKDVYNVVIKKVTFRPASAWRKNWENEISFVLEIADGPYQGQALFSDVEAKLTDHPRNRLRNHLEAIFGTKLDDTFVLKTETLDSFVGLGCRVYVDHYWSKKNNRDQHEVKDIMPPIGMTENFDESF